MGKNKVKLIVLLYNSCINACTVTDPQVLLLILLTSSGGLRHRLSRLHWTGFLIINPGLSCLTTHTWFPFRLISMLYMFPLSVTVPMFVDGVSTSVGAAVMLYILCITGIVSFNEVYPRSFVWVQPCVFVYVFVLGVLKNPIVYTCACLQVHYTSVTGCALGSGPFLIHMGNPTLLQFLKHSNRCAWHLRPYSVQRHLNILSCAFTLRMAHIHNPCLNCLKAWKPFFNLSPLLHLHWLKLI